MSNDLESKTVDNLYAIAERSNLSTIKTRFINAQLENQRSELHRHIDYFMEIFGKKPYNKVFNLKKSLCYPYFDFFQDYYGTKITQEFKPSSGRGYSSALPTHEQRSCEYPDSEECYKVSFGKSKEEIISELREIIEELRKPMVYVPQPFVDPINKN